MILKKTMRFVYPTTLLLICCPSALDTFFLMRTSLVLTCVIRVDILHLEHPLRPKDLQSLVVAVVGEPGEVDGAEAAGGEGEGDEDVVVVVNVSNLLHQTVGRGVDLNQS